MCLQMIGQFSETVSEAQNEDIVLIVEIIY